MPKETQTTAAAASKADPIPAKETLTKWRSLKSYAPVEILCGSYFPYHRGDQSCHTRLRFDINQIKKHLEADHGGGLIIKLRNSDKPVEFWEKFIEADFESLDFRCEVCDKQVPFQVNHIAAHMRPHTGKTRRVREGGLFNLTIQCGTPAPSETDAFEENG